MSIDYKTEGRCILPSDKTSVGLAITWVKGSDTAVLMQGGDGRITLSKKQLQDIGRYAEIIADDLQPDMGLLPRPV